MRLTRTLTRQEDRIFQISGTSKEFTVKKFDIPILLYKEEFDYGYLATLGSFPLRLMSSTLGYDFVINGNGWTISQKYIETSRSDSFREISNHVWHCYNL